MEEVLDRQKTVTLRQQQLGQPGAPRLVGEEEGDRGGIAGLLPQRVQALGIGGRILFSRTALVLAQQLHRGRGALAEVAQDPQRWLQMT